LIEGLKAGFVEVVGIVCYLPRVGSLGLTGDTIDYGVFLASVESLVSSFY